MVGAGLLLLITVIQDRATRPALKEANDAALRSYAFTDAALRNGEVVRAMGMVEPLGSRWAASARSPWSAAPAPASAPASCSNVIQVRGATWRIQVLIIAIGAYLVGRRARSTRACCSPT